MFRPARAQGTTQPSSASQKLLIVLIGTVVLLSGLVVVPTPGAAVPASDATHTLTQPDGTEFEAVQWGDEWYGGWETTDGYTIVQNDTSGWWYYAKLQSGDLVPTDQRVGVDPPDGLQKHLRGDYTTPSFVPSEYGDSVASASAHGGCTGTIPSTGDVSVPVLTANFTDTNPTYTPNQFEQLLFGDDPSIATGPGSLQDYFEEASYGGLDFNSGPEDVSGWYPASNSESYYGNQTQGGAPNNRVSPRAPELVEETVRTADNQGFDFSQYDNDGDGCVAVVVLFQGNAESQSRQEDDIWPHRFDLASAPSTSPVEVDGVTVNSYSLQPETDTRTGNIKSIGTIAHETGHLFGLPDLYDTNGGSAGIGEWGLMGSANFNQVGGVAGDAPAHPNVLMKQRLGWTTATPSPTRIAPSGQQGILPPITDSSLHYKIGSHQSGDEYFLVVNRRQEGFDAGLNGEGMLIWHVDETQNNNDNENDKLIDLEGADGNADLDAQRNRGDAGDPFPGSSGTTKFADGTSPSANWKDGTASGVDLQNIELDNEAAMFNDPPERTLGVNESAAYAVPVGRSTPSGFSDYTGPIDVLAAGENNPVDIVILPPTGVPTTSALLSDQVSRANNIGLSLPTTDRDRSSNSTSPNATLPFGGYKVVYGSPPHSQQLSFRSAVNYPEYPLPSKAEVVGRDLAAGGNTNPNQIAFDLVVTTAGEDYTYGNFGPPDASHFNITVDGHRIPPSALTVVEQREHRYQIRATPPPQRATGTYDLCVSFTDKKLGVSHTARDCSESIEYTTKSGQTSTSIIIDDSGSMRGQKIDSAKTAGRTYVSLLADSDYAAVVGYDSSPRVSQSLVLVKGNRSDLRDAIVNLRAGGLTDIGGGMTLGLQELVNGPDGTIQAAVLLSDGIENRGTISASQAAQNYRQQGIPVYTIALGSGADKQLMQDVATSTGGRFFETGDPSNLQEIYSEINRDVTNAALIRSASGQLDPNARTSVDFSLDDTVDNTNVEVSLDTTTPGPGTSESGPSLSSHSGEAVHLYYPNGTRVKLNSSTASGTDNPDISYTATGSTTIYQIKDPNPGDWSYTINNTQSSSATYDSKVTATTSTTFSAGTDADQYTSGTKTTLSGTFLNGSGPVSGGSVTAEIIEPDGTVTQVQLTEDRPGTYTGSFTNMANGTYSAKIKATIGSVKREQVVTWTVVDPESVLNISTQKTVRETPQGGKATLNVTFSDPGQSQSAATDSDVVSRFQSRVREYIQSPPDERTELEELDAVRQVAEILLNQTQSEESALDVANEEIAPQHASSGGTTVYVKTTALTGPRGAKIPASQVILDRSSLSLASGDSGTVSLTIKTRDDLPVGTYTGSVVGVANGTVVNHEIKVNVTKADKSVYIGRIQRAASQWETASPAGKTYYESQIADHLTTIYFGDINSTSSSTSQDDTLMEGS